MPLSLSDIPPEIKDRVEDNDYLAECDWGFCGRPTWGFARSDADAENEWLTICKDCAAGNFGPSNEFPVPVVQVFEVAAVEKLMWPDGIVSEHLLDQANALAMEDDDD